MSFHYCDSVALGPSDKNEATENIAAKASSTFELKSTVLQVFIVWHLGIIHIKL